MNELELLRRIQDLERKAERQQSHSHGVGVGVVTNGNAHDHSGGDGAQINHTTLSNIGTNTHAQIDTFIGTKAAANGLASLGATSLVVQNPANATATSTASKIPIADGSGKLDTWVSDASATVKGKVELATDGESAAGLAVQSNDGRLATDGWLAIAATWTRTSNTTFTAVGNVTALFPAGTKIKVTDTTTKYFYVLGAVFTTLTTVTITGGIDFVLAANPTARWVSYSATPQGFPQWFNWTPTWGGFSAAPGVTDAVFNVVGRLVTVVVNCSGNGTSNATTLTITNIPIAPAYNARGVLGYAVNNNAAVTVACRMYIAAASTTMVAHTDMAIGVWVNSSGKRADFCITYGI